MVVRPDEGPSTPAKHYAICDKDNVPYGDKEPDKSTVKKTSWSMSRIKKFGIGDHMHVGNLNSKACEVRPEVSTATLTESHEGSKRKGDLEFEIQLQMALSATSAGSSEPKFGSVVKDMHNCSPSSSFKRLKMISEESPSSSTGISTAIGAKKIGAPLYWAEVYCSGENVTGKWVHVDAVNAIIDGEQKVEAAAAACKVSLRYAVAFAGQGAKDVTRRYCEKWYRIASHRISSNWWDAVLAPLKVLESGATGVPCLSETTILSGQSTVEARKENGRDLFSSNGSSVVATRTLLEDMDLETKALTEPLPSNQQAYRNHHLYALERWLTKYQILHPKGPVLGFCSGHPVYPRTCVQTLHTKERWLREGLQIKANELPAKVLEGPLKPSKAQVLEVDDCEEGECKGSGSTIALFGKWQTEPLCLPRAENGIVPKNERGQVDVWSEKCLPPGTVHLRLPRVFTVAKKLDIDYAPAMVGFEFRNGRSFPLYDGIVVCEEFKDIILEAYAEEEGRREAEDRKKNEAQAISRWYQLLSSIVTRQRLNSRYVDGASSFSSNDIKKDNCEFPEEIDITRKDEKSSGLLGTDSNEVKHDAPKQLYTEDHEHVFFTDDQIFDEKNTTRTKRCCCGFSIEVEEL